MKVLEIFIIVCIVLYAVYNAYKYYRRKMLSASFKEAYNLTDLPIIGLKYSDKVYYFLLDSGSDESYLDYRIIEELNLPKVDKSVQVMSFLGSSNVSNFYSIKFDNDFETNVGAVDIKSVFKPLDDKISIDGILGSKFLTKYKCIMDFDHMVIYNNDIPRN